MGKNKLQKTLTNTLSQIDGAMAALDSYPELEDALLSKAQGLTNKYLGKLFPTQLDFSKEVLEHLVGTDALIEIVSDFLSIALPEVEVSLKAALLANMNNLGSGCTIDPIIYEKAIKEGVIFDLKQIDLIDKLSVSPLDKKLGQYYYFGIENCESAYDVLQSAINPVTEEDGDSKQKTSYIGSALTNSVGHYFGKRKKDFDCLLWYMKNKAAYREVWGKRTTASEDIFNGGEDIIAWLDKKGSKKTTYYQIDGGKLTFYSYNDGNWSKKSGGECKPMGENYEYSFYEGKTFYTYKYGKPQIKKVSRKKYYLIVDQVYYYYGTDWTSQTVDKTQYKSIDELPVTIKEGSAVYIDNVLYVIKSFKEKEGAYGVKTRSNIKTSEVIDATNDVLNKTCMYVDYDQHDNKKKIDEGKLSEVTSAFGVKYDNVQKTWNKERVKDTKGDETENIKATDLWYIKNTPTDVTDFNADVDTIAIPPHNIEGNNSKQYVNVNDAQKDCKYTKDFGVVTLEYSPRTGNVKQSDGDPLQQQTPYDNVLHVFFGNVKELPDTNRTGIQKNLKSSSETNKLGVQIFNKVLSIENSIYSEWEEKIKEWKTRNRENKKIGKKEEDITKKDENIIFKTIYSLFKAIRIGDATINPSLTAESPLYDNLTGLNDTLTSINALIDKYFEKKKIIKTDADGNKITVETNEYKFKNELTYDNFTAFKNELQTQLYGGTEGKEIYSITAFVYRAAQIMEANENLLYLSAKDVKYPEAYKNYYLRRTLFEFNTDYINSLQLFDTKVLAAQLITSLFGGVTMSAILGATASWKTELIRDTVKNMVEKCIAAQDYTVSDCFFTFTNDSYNTMLKATELRQAGLYSRHGEENGDSTINPIELLEGLNKLDSAADQNEQISIIKGTILNVSEEISKDTYKENNSLSINANFTTQMSFVETLVENLCTQLIMAMLSPKVYLCILINLQMFGLTTNFDLKSFIQNFENLIMAMVKSVVDKFMEHLSSQIIKIVEDLVEKLKVKIAFEQAEMYMRLLKQIFQHLKALTTCGDGEGWTQDIVGSADITDSDSQETTNEC